MGKLFLFLSLLMLLLTVTFRFQAGAAAPAAGPIIKHLSSLLKLTKSISKSSQSDGGHVLQYEEGYIVETVVDGNALGVVPYSIRVSQDGELFAVDAENSNIVRITPPLSQYSRARLVAGSFQGKTGHIDGKPSDARFNHPNGVAMDDNGNVYVADTVNFAIRKIGEASVTTIAGGKSTVAGYRDGPSEDAKFSSDFDIVYVRPTCSLLVVDRGNAALRQISLNRDDCDYQYSSISSSDILMVIGAIMAGYVTCALQQGFGASAFTKTPSAISNQSSKQKQNPAVFSIKGEPVTVWPSFGQLVSDLSKLAVETANKILLRSVPSRLRHIGPNKGLKPLKDTLKMPEDGAKKHRAPPPFSEVHHAYSNNPAAGDKYLDTKPQKMRSVSLKDPTISSKHRYSRRQEYTEFHGSSNEVSANQAKSKSQKEMKHRHRDKGAEVAYGAIRSETKSVEAKAAVNYEDPKFDHYNLRTRYAHQHEPYGF